MTPEERKRFDEAGVVRLAGAVGPELAAGLRREILAFIEERELAPGSPEPGFTLMPSAISEPSRRRGFAETWGSRVTRALHSVLGENEWSAPSGAGQVLFMTWPDPALEWSLPHGMWHLDYMAPTALTRLPGVQLFLCIDRIESRAGGTLVAAGTPALIDRIRRRQKPDWEGRSADVRGLLRRELPWFRELCSLREGEDRIGRFMTEATVHDGVSLQVLELTGERGDVWVMHPWMLHSLSKNCGARPRMALTQRIEGHH